MSLHTNRTTAVLGDRVNLVKASRGTTASKTDDVTTAPKSSGVAKPGSTSRAIGPSRNKSAEASFLKKAPVPSARKALIASPKQVSTAKPLKPVRKAERPVLNAVNVGSSDTVEEEHVDGKELVESDRKKEAVDKAEESEKLMEKRKGQFLRENEGIWDIIH